MIKVFRVFKVLANVALFCVLAYFIAGMLNELFVYVTELNIRPENIYLYNDKFIPTQVESIVEILLDLVEFVASIGTIGLFIIFFLIYCYQMNKRTIGINGRSINNLVFGKVDLFAYKIIGFHKSKIYWVICVLTSFIPFFVPLFVSWALRLLIFAIKLICGPVLLFISQIKSALNGAIA